MRLDLLAALIAVATAAVTLNFPAGVTVSSRNTLVSNVAYTINMTFGSAISIPALSYILLQFSPNFIIDNTTVGPCRYLISGSSYSNATCNTDYNSNNALYEINILGIYPALASNQVSLNLLFYMMNPMGEGTEHININLMSGSTKLAGGLITLDYVPSSLSGCSYVSSNDTTGVSSNRTISFLPTVPAIANSNLFITLPPWFADYPSNSAASEYSGAPFTCEGVTNSDSAAPLCESSMGLDTTTSNNYEQFTVSGLINSNKVFSTPIVFKAMGINNPFSLAPFGPIRFELKIYDGLSGTYVTSQTCTGIYQTVTKMNIPASVSSTISTTLQISTTYTNRQVRLTTREPFPAIGQVVLSFPSSVQITYPLALYPSAFTSTSFTFSEVVSSDQVAFGSPITIGGLDIITPPSSRPFNITITTQWMTGGVTYGIDSNSILYACQTGPLTSVSAVPTTTSVNAVTQYVLTFTTTNALISGSFVSILFPSELTATVGSCTTNNALISCSVTNTSYASLAITGVINALSTIIVTFPSVKNPKQVLTTSSFQINTYYDSGTDSKVDTITSGVTMLSTSNPITTATVTPLSFVTYALTSYVIFAALPDLIPANGYVKINFPSTITFGNLSISSASFTKTTCTISPVATSVSLNGCFSTDMTSSNISITLSGIYNPPSLQPTTTFSIFTYGPLGMVDSIITGLTITMVTPATATSFTISPLSSVVHTFTQYNLAFTYAVPHQANDYIVMTIPASMAFTPSPTCVPISGISVNCILLNTTSIQITMSAAPSASSQFSISTIRNYDVATSQSFQLFFYNSANYAMETTPLASTTYTAASISIISINNNDQIALYQSSNLTLTITTPFEMDSSFLVAQTQLIITPPATFSITGSTTFSSSSGICSFANGSLTISSVGLALSAFTVTISKVTLPYFSPTSSSFSIVYAYGASQVAKVNSGVVVSVFCTSPCERCVSTQTSCASCLPAPNTAIYLYSVNSSCLNSCPNGYYANSTYCVICNEPCLYCQDSVNCTKCTPTTYLYNKACQTTCPPTFFGNSSNICDACISPCYNCTTSSTTCTSCLTNFYSNFTCVTAANCPAGTFAETSSKTCASCNTPPCSTCSLTSSNCTSCVVGFVLYQNGCSTQCPSLFYNNSNFCIACVPPCGNCTSSTACLSCLTDYLSSGSCVTASNCPVGTFPDSPSSSCVTCTVGCASCISASNCSSCTSVNVFYNFTCLISCPNTTYQSITNNCILCSGCQTCSGSSTSCTSCTPPQFLSGTSCVSSCPPGTYQNGVNCLACSSTCSTCTGSSTTCNSCPSGLYLSGINCITSCPSGTFQDSSKNNCSACSPTCNTCASSATSCTSCSGSTVYYQGSCISGCPGNYFNINGICQTCSNCAVCLSVSVCGSCNSGYYMLNGVCYSTCPATSISDSSTMTCTPCNSTCATCSGTTANCLTCVGGLYLLNSVCFSSCPSGYMGSGGECIKTQLGSIIYFPFSITFAVFLIIVIYSKVHHSQTESVTALCGILALLVWISWIVLVYQANNTDIQLVSSTRNIIFGIGMVGIIVSVVLGLIFAVWFRISFKADNGFNQWACHTNSNLNVYRLAFCMTFVAFPCFRIVYSRLFNNNSLSCFFIKGGELLSGSAKFAFLYVVTCLFPLLFVSGYVIYIKPSYDQTLISSIDSLLLDIFLVILLIIDTHSKDESFFNQMIENQPYLKKLKYDDLNNSLSSLRDGEQNHHGNAGHRSEVAEKDKEEFFRTKINVVDNLNKFGQLNTPIPEKPGQQRKIKTLPNDLEKLPQFDVNQDQIQVIDDDFFFQEEEKRRRIQEEERLRLEQQERKRREQLLAEERERKRQLADEDIDEQHQVQFPDLAAIERIEKKGESMKKSPTHILSNFKKVEDRNISQKDRKKVEDIAKKNGLDPTFMAETFGVQKNHNPELLNSIIDIHNHVDREAVKALFSPQSNPEVLQELFSKKSNMDPQRLRNILNDPQSGEMIKKLVNSEDGILAPDVAKLLLDGNSKFSQEFVKQLLKSSKGQALDPDKLRQILLECPDKASRQAALKALKKVGGNNLQNKALLENLLGEESLLQAASFTRVVNDLSKKAVEHLFREKSQKNNTIISKLLNNKKIDLKNLNTILEDPELVEELAKALSGDNKILEENLLNLFKNGEQLDPQLLKEFLTRPGLLDKLVSQPIDPAFMTNLLKKGAQTDLSLLEKAIELMTPEQIGKVFEFNPQKNVDFAKVARLFEYNSKTDPALISQLLTPQVVENVYNKASNARPQMLNKLVQKGKQVDPEAVLKIYGDDRVFRQTGRPGEMGGRGGQLGGGMGEGGRRLGEVGGRMMDIDNMEGNMDGNMGNRQMSRKYNNTDNNFNLIKQDFEDELGYKKGANELNMSRTDGRMLGFLSPIQVGQHRNKKYKNGLDPVRGRNKNNINDIDDIDDLDDEEITEYNDGDGGKGEDDQYEIVEEGGKRRRRKKIKKKPLDDIRLPSEHIYLQRLEAPHELKKKNIRKKKKKGSSSMQQLEPMDEDNEVYDLDF